MSYTAEQRAVAARVAYAALREVGCTPDHGPSEGASVGWDTPPMYALRAHNLGRMAAGLEPHDMAGFVGDRLSSASSRSWRRYFSIHGIEVDR